MWFCAHAIMYFKLIDAAQESFLIHENVYLVEAKGTDEADLIARKIGQSSEDPNEDGHLELNEQKAAYLFAGIRKIIEVEISSETISAINLSGREVTYSVYEVDTFEDVCSLANGDMVDVLYRE
ncbi:hypothetical protein ACFJIX_14375 [Roseateles sp. UC29_93]|uniref:hypothetical protein n=1 Tax=Roseateles sp. UC29_93 TaxID=3350177 RepID=UPI00366DB562